MKQQLSKMNDWLSKAERKMKKENELGPNYETVKKQLEEHQVIPHKSVNIIKLHRTV